MAEKDLSLEAASEYYEDMQDNPLEAEDEQKVLKPETKKKPKSTRIYLQEKNDGS